MMMLCFGWYFAWRYDVKSLRLRLQGLGAGFVIQPKEFKLQSSHESGVPCIEKVGLELLSESPMLKADADHLRILYLQNGRLLRFQPLFQVLLFVAWVPEKLEKTVSASALLWVCVFWVLLLSKASKGSTQSDSSVLVKRTKVSRPVVLHGFFTHIFFRFLRLVIVIWLT